MTSLPGRPFSGPYLLAIEERGFDGLWLPDHMHIPVSRQICALTMARGGMSTEPGAWTSSLVRSPLMPAGPPAPVSAVLMARAGAKPC